jgi:ATP-dependent Clp protease ATP-binding subunit ClpA
MGVSSPSGPAGVMLFTGSTGLGKTELTEVLARFDGGENAKPIRIALSEYKGKGAVSRLTGADPGLIGFDLGSPTLEEVEKNPRVILMFDEIDKADPSVFDVLMQILEKGEIRLASGKLLDFKNTIVVLGSNSLKAEDLTDDEMAHQDLHQDEIRKKLLQARSKDTGELLFRPEFIRRIRDIFVFQPLGKPQYVDILAKEIRKVNRDYAGNNIKVDLERGTAETLVSHFNIDSMGGGGPKWIVDQVVRSRLTDYLMDRLMETRGDKSKINDRLRIEFKEGKAIMERADDTIFSQSAGKPIAPQAAAMVPAFN